MTKLKLQHYSPAQNVHSWESTCFKLQYDPYLIWEECSLSELYILRENVRYQIRFCSLKKLKLANLMIVQVLSCIMILVSPPLRVPSPSYLFCGKIGRSGKGVVHWKRQNSLTSTYRHLASIWTLFRLRSVFLDWVIHFAKKLVDQVKNVHWES